MPTTQAPSSGASKTKDQPLFGLWKDRDDLNDPAAYLRDLRLPRQAPAQASMGPAAAKG